MSVSAMRCVCVHSLIPLVCSHCMHGTVLLAQVCVHSGQYQRLSDLIKNRKYSEMSPNVNSLDIAIKTRA